MTMNILHAICRNLTCLLLMLASAHAAEPVKIGVLAYRPKPQTLAQWQPLAAALKQAIPERDFVIEAFDYPELDAAVATRQLDFVLTNSGHYILLMKRSGMSAPLATLAENMQGKPVSVLGGVIFSLANNAAIRSLHDLKGKTLAATSTEAMYGYQVEAYELKQAGMHLPQDARMLFTGMPLDKVADAVLEGRADAGFARAGVLEEMAREGKLDMGKIRIINRQALPDFPAQVSTHLYPGWPFAALPHIDENLSRRVAAALFLLEESPAVTNAMSIHGFVIPADYTLVSDMLRELRLPPFDAAPDVALQDVLHQYRWWIIIILIACGLILLLGLHLLVSNRRLNAERRTTLLQNQQLDESERRYHFMFNNNPLPMWVFAEGSLKFLEVNERALEHYGYTREEFGLMTLRDIRPAKEIAELDRVIAGSANGKALIETRHKIKSGTLIDVIVTTMPMKYGAIPAGIVLVQDITERKQAEKKLWEKNQLLDSIFENIPNMIFLKRASDLRFELFNKAGEALLGLGRDKLLGCNDYDFFPKEQADFFTGKDRATLEQGGIVDIPEEPIETPHGTRILHTRKLTLKDEQGQPQYLLGISEDITERKQAESALKRHKTVIDTAHDGFWMYDTSGYLLEVNQAYADLMGYTREELTGMHISKLSALSNTPELVKARMEMVIQQGASCHFETRHRHKDGHIVHFETSNTYMPELNLVFSFLRDIGKRKEYEEELKRSNVELEQFSYAVSHDMRQPLRMIASYLQLLEKSLPDLDNEKRDYFNYAVEGAKRIDKMLVALLEYSRVGRSGEAPAKIDSRTALDEALQFLESAMSEAQARLNISGDWPQIYASHDEILRLIQNLVGNAIKYRVSGRIPEIVINSEIVGNEWHLNVTDNGVGIIPDQIKRLFQVFQRLQSRDAFEGTGIGLALCRKIAEHHKGRIWAESAGAGQGSRFCVVLPVVQEQT